MEQEYYYENGMDVLDKDKLMAEGHDRCIKQVKYDRILAILWLIITPLVDVWVFRGVIWKDWICALTPLGMGIICLFDLFWYGKMSKCDDDKQLLSLFKKGNRWYNVVTALPCALFGFTLGAQLWGDICERYGIGLYVAAIILLGFAIFTILFSAVKRKAFKGNVIDGLRELNDIDELEDYDLDD